MSDRELVELNINVDREAFVRDTALGIIRSLKEDTIPLWGIMTARHMVEHLIFITGNTLGYHPVPLLIPEEKLPRYKAFLMSSKGFMRNFKFPMLPENDLPNLKFNSLSEAVNALEVINKQFIETVNASDFKTAPHPFYGRMNREEAIMFQFKHLMHHFMQFGLISA